MVASGLLVYTTTFEKTKEKIHKKNSAMHEIHHIVHIQVDDTKWLCEIKLRWRIYFGEIYCECAINRNKIYTNTLAAANTTKTQTSSFCVFFKLFAIAFWLFWRNNNSNTKKTTETFKNACQNISKTLIVSEKYQIFKRKNNWLKITY